MRVLDRNGSCAIVQPRAFLFRAALNLCTQLYRNRRGSQVMTAGRRPQKPSGAKRRLQDERLLRRAATGAAGTGPAGVSPPACQVRPS